MSLSGTAPGGGGCREADGVNVAEAAEKPPRAPGGGGRREAGGAVVEGAGVRGGHGRELARRWCAAVPHLRRRPRRERPRHGYSQVREDPGRGPPRVYRGALRGARTTRSERGGEPRPGVRDLDTSRGRRAPRRMVSKSTASVGASGKPKGTNRGSERHAAHPAGTRGLCQNLDHKHFLPPPAPVPRAPATPCPPVGPAPPRPLPPGPSPPRPAPPRPSHLRRPPRDGSGREPRPRRQGGSPGLEEKLHLGKPDGSLSLTRRVPCVPGCPRRPPPPKNDGNLREMYEPRPQIFDSVAINLKRPHKSDVNNDT